MQLVDDCVGSFCDEDFKACTAINTNPAVLCVLKSLFSNWSDVKGLNVNSCAGFCKATLLYINKGCGLKCLGMFNTVHLSKNMMKSLFAVPRKLSHEQWSTLSPSLPVGSRLNGTRQAPELGKCLCNLSSDTALPAALPRKWEMWREPWATRHNTMNPASKTIVAGMLLCSHMPAATTN